MKDTFITTEMNGQERKALDKFTKFLTLKVAQIVVQSRQGKKISLASIPEHESIVSECEVSPPTQVYLTKSTDWFNLAIPELVEVTKDTKKLLNGEVITALYKEFIIEISLKTEEGDEMILELWTIKVDPACDSEMISLSTIYYRMGIMLKSTLTVSRITPAYKISRSQNKEYCISYRIYSGEPDTNVLGEGFRSIKVSDLGTACGTIQISLFYRTVMTLPPSKKTKGPEPIMVQSKHFQNENHKRDHEKKVIDLSKPLTAGAFVDTEHIKKLHDTLSQQLPPEPPMSWLLAEKERTDQIKLKPQPSNCVDMPKSEVSSEVASSSAPTTVQSKAIEVPRSKTRYNSESQKYAKVMEFPFADGSPITELANFYQECLHAKSHVSDDWCDAADDTKSVSTDSDNLSRQLKLFEDAVPEFDSMVASMFSNSDNGEF